MSETTRMLQDQIETTLAVPGEQAGVIGNQATIMEALRELLEREEPKEPEPSVVTGDVTRVRCDLFPDRKCCSICGAHIPITGYESTDTDGLYCSTRCLAAARNEHQQDKQTALNFIASGVCRLLWKCKGTEDWKHFASLYEYLRDAISLGAVELDDRGQKMLDDYASRLKAIVESGADTPPIAVEQKIDAGVVTWRCDDSPVAMYCVRCGRHITTKGYTRDDTIALYCSPQCLASGRQEGEATARDQGPKFTPGVEHILTGSAHGEGTDICTNCRASMPNQYFRPVGTPDYGEDIFCSYNCLREYYDHPISDADADQPTPADDAKTLRAIADHTFQPQVNRNVTLLRIAARLEETVDQDVAAARDRFNANIEAWRKAAGCPDEVYLTDWLEKLREKADRPVPPDGSYVLAQPGGDVCCPTWHKVVDGHPVSCKKPEWLSNKNSIPLPEGSYVILCTEDANKWRRVEDGKLVATKRPGMEPIW